MAEIIISSYFEDNVGPVTGLSPTLRIWEITITGETLIVGAPCGSGLNTDGNMVEVTDCGSPATTADGFYRFTFNTAIGYDPVKTYVVRVDGGVSLAAAFRYQTTRISPADAVDATFIENAVWDASSASHTTAGTMGAVQNNTFVSVETIRITDIPAVFSLMDMVRKYNTNRTKIDPTNNTLTIYDDDCVTPLRIFRLLDSTGTPSTAEVCERTSIAGSGAPPGTGADGFPTCSTTAP